ncbi:MAG: acyl--CoA ligase [Actinomycetota bacterium]|nr:acyl--CoA ligase [Actinomycetota bacterium]
MSGQWVDDLLLAGPDDQACLRLGDQLDLAALREAVGQAELELRAAGLSVHGTAAIYLPPSLSYVVTVLAVWRIGAQAQVIDHRLTEHELDRALTRLRPQLIIRPVTRAGGALRGFQVVTARIDLRPDGVPSATAHAMVQLSSGSTGPSKVIGRTVGELVDEVHRYAQVDGMPVRGERLVVLSSMAHAYGLMGGLLHSLHSGVEIVLPERATVDGIRRVIAESQARTTVMGVPFHFELLASVADPEPLPQLVAAVSAGDRLRPDVAEAFRARYGVRVGEIYGMTEMGLIAADMSGANRPATGWPAPGIEVRVENGELLVARPVTPYLGEADPTRWVDGWLRTKDAATIDDETGLITVLGRLDSQVAVGGMKVDLTEVEQTIVALDEVAIAVVTFTGSIEVYLELAGDAELSTVETKLTERLAVFKRPKRFHLMSTLPRTATGKPVRDVSVLREAAAVAIP